MNSWVETVVVLETCWFVPTLEVLRSLVFFFYCLVFFLQSHESLTWTCDLWHFLYHLMRGWMLVWLTQGSPMWLTCVTSGKLLECHQYETLLSKLFLFSLHLNSLATILPLTLWPLPLPFCTLLVVALLLGVRCTPAIPTSSFDDVCLGASQEVRSDQVAQTFCHLVS